MAEYEIDYKKQFAEIVEETNHPDSIAHAVAKGLGCTLAEAVRIIQMEKIFGRLYNMDHHLYLICHHLLADTEPWKDDG